MNEKELIEITLREVTRVTGHPIHGNVMRQIVDNTLAIVNNQTLVSETPQNAVIKPQPVLTSKKTKKE